MKLAIEMMIGWGRALFWGALCVRNLRTQAAGGVHVAGGGTLWNASENRYTPHSASSS